MSTTTTTNNNGNINSVVVGSEQTPLLLQSSVPSNTNSIPTLFGHPVSKRSAMIIKALAIAVIFLLAVLFVGWLAPSSQKNKGPRQEIIIDHHKLRAGIEKIRVDSGLVGGAVGIVHKGKLVFAEGFGYRDREKNLLVTPKTRFQIGSVSKSFTALATALAVQNGFLNWTTPITKLYPNVSFKDPFTNSEANMLDLLSHRTGLPRYDILGFFLNSSESIASRIQYMDAKHAFRTKFEYCNNAFSLAGITTAAKVTGSSSGYIGMMTKEVFEPLGMLETTADIMDMWSMEASLPYFRFISGSYHTFPNDIARHVIGGTPAGAIVSTIEDMAKYATMMLNKGKLPNGETFIGSEFDMLHTPQMFANPSSKKRPVHQTTCATFGFLSDLQLIPSEDLAIIVLSNTGNSYFIQAITPYLLDTLLYPDLPTDWSSFYKAEQEQSYNDLFLAQETVLKMRNPSVPPSAPLSQLTGTYTHPAYGNLTIIPHQSSASTSAATALKLSASLQVGKDAIDTPQPTTFNLEHWVGDLFGVTEWVLDYEVNPISLELEIPMSFANFVVSNGGVVGIEFDFEGDVKVRFEKVGGSKEVEKESVRGGSLVAGLTVGEMEAFRNAVEVVREVSRRSSF
ncbi:hypothetical protein HDU76_000152 [Blyttiomyces sp. JEL0837]|nr:hypothetical protein HDU76_000152 [Blyttiomyces sp. JEL0837]